MPLIDYLAQNIVTFHLHGYLRDLRAEKRWVTEAAPRPPPGGCRCHRRRARPKGTGFLNTADRRIEGRPGVDPGAAGPTLTPMSLHAVIMAGGSGTRFWPASRRAPQAVPAARARPAADRSHARPPARPRARSRTHLDRHQPEAGEDAHQAAAALRPRRQILEPEPRDTAPCVALATATIAARDPAATMVVMPADHVIEPIGAFQRHAAARRRAGEPTAARWSRSASRRPLHPATGYGYIECGPAPRPGQDLPPSRRPASARSPTAPPREQFLQQGNFLWNSGIFVWTRSTAIRAAMARTNPALAAGTEAMLMALQKRRSAATTRAFLQGARRRSIDYARDGEGGIGRSSCAALRWDDVGSFPALTAVGAADADGNVSRADGRRAASLPCRAATTSSTPTATAPWRCSACTTWSWSPSATP
jgi:mannose-1-phosphate guanylyltransferase